MATKRPAGFGEMVLINWWALPLKRNLNINWASILFPIQAPLLYLACDTATILKAYDEAATLDDGIGDLWEDIMWGYLAMAKPSEALAAYQAHTSNSYYNNNLPWLPNVTGIYNDFSDYSLAPAQIFHWLHVLDSVGIVDTTCSDYPATLVFIRDDFRHYVIDNTSNGSLVVHFSDGQFFTAPPDSLFLKKVVISSCNSPIPVLKINNEAVSGYYIARSICTTEQCRLLMKRFLKQGIVLCWAVVLM